ncbi:MAG TPA: hypothetical protein VGP47_03620, partial [Parachlamydiaceae bacterium]|nr:hypothetical protein [Parachlamydiaceae bacterium]
MITNCECTTHSPSLWDKNATVRKYAEDIEIYLSKCIKLKDAKSIITDSEVFLASCCREAGRPYLDTIFCKALKGFVEDVEKVRCLLENFYSRKIFKIYIIRTDEGECYFKEDPRRLVFDLAKDKRGAVDDYYKNVLPALNTSIFKRSCKYFRVSQIPGKKPLKLNVGILEFLWTPITLSNSESRYINYEYLNFLREDCFFCDIASKDKKTLKIHAKLLPWRFDIFNNTAKTLEYT